MAIQPGQVHHQRYKFERLIGQGAFGAMWQGEHLVLHRPVAIKVIDASKLDADSLERAIRECQIGGQLNNAHVVNVFDAYQEGSDLCIVMELMTGGSLKDYLTRHQPGLSQGLQWGLDLAGALAAVHQAGIIHRDIKPANILLTGDGHVKIADFGIAHLPGSQLTGEFQPGTPAYRSPEQEANQRVDKATDVYALSAVLFELFSGQKFYQRKGITLTEWRRELRHRLAQRFPTAPDLRLAELTDGLADGLAADKSNRSTLSQLQQALRAVLESLPPAESSPPAEARPLSSETPSSHTASDQTPIARIDRYELQALIGRGGMGTVHKAYDPRIDRLVALKTITVVDPSWRARFQQEARIAGRLNHPHIVTVYDVGEIGDTAYIVMELVEGQTLADMLPVRLAWSEAVKLLLPVGRALAYAHRQGVIHRDVKPANILLASDGRVKLTDFGIARLETSRQLTQTGAVIGTPLYMAPEQLAGQPIDERADLYALGVILFELVAGGNPFGSEDSTPAWGLLNRPDSPDFGLLAELAPGSLQAVLQQTLALEPADRFATVADLVQALVICLDDHDTAEKKRVTATITLPQVEINSSVVLSTVERELLAEAFSDHNRIYIERELLSAAPASKFDTSKRGAGFEGERQDRLLVVLPIRSGRSLARIIVKLASPELLRAEWKAYQEYVADILPLVTAHIQGAPLLAPDRKLALLRYTFSGDVGEREAESLADYYQDHTGPDISALLERNIFQAVAPNWWLNRETDRFPLRREYGQLLPVHLVIDCTAQPDPDVPALVLKAGTIAAREVQELESGRAVQIQGFRVQASRPAQKTLILETPAPTGKATERLRLQLTGLSPDQLKLRPGDLAPNFAGVIVATRRELLLQAAQTALPAADLTQSTIGLGTTQVANPLRRYESILERSVSGMRSIIHGELTFDSVLVEPESGLSWLINFGSTRTGHNLYDFIQLEVQVVTRLLPELMTGTQPLDDEIIAMARSLHTATPPAAAPHPILQKPYELLCTIRRLASQCMLDPERWEEYYLGLMLMLLGALSRFHNQPGAARLVFAWAAAAGELADRPLRPATVIPEPTATATAMGKYLWSLAGAVGIIFVLTLGGFLIWWNGWTSSLIAAISTPTSTSTITFTPSSTTVWPTNTPTPSPTATATSTPSPTPIPTSTPGATQGTLAGALNVYSGPGTSYEFVGTTSDTVVTVTGIDKSGGWLKIDWSSGSGWVEANFVEIETGVNLPVLTVPPPATFTPTPTNTFTPIPPTPTPSNTPLPTGSPTASSNALRNPVSSTAGYRVLDNQAMAARDPSSASFSPDGRELAATEGIKLYTIGTDGSSPLVWLEENEDIRPVEAIVWSPNGALFAFVADRKRNCNPCRTVGIIVRADTARPPFYLSPPEGHNIDLPRWTQDGRLLVTIYRDNADNGTVYEYDTSGRGQPATGTYVLSSSLEGQSWQPWQPGKTWTVNPGNPTGYYRD
ncbi:MAG: protein kinase [Chloroflexota bacterium]